ncbi:helicase-associated domain-containing protein [Microbacterium sp. Marseille-Q6965]|uniref:helicase-associated domain-containing protein n=1 Tax=Microbacterium sp. Marseille-Q6965 TaxID=2965072 RepID=UPI0021B72111|nr:helicase-associated domain-containing protein [Microbacterium sp. Marseille-Q6965]
MVAEARTLAERLAAREDGEIARLLSARRISAHVPWRSWFDAAEALLDPASIAAALRALPRDDLHALRTGSGPEQLGLTDAQGRPFAPVAEALPHEITPTPARAPRPASSDAAAHAAERAFTATTALADLLIDALRVPLGRVATGLAATERKRLVQEELARDGDEADALVRAAELAGLLRGQDRRWLVTSAGAEWIRRSTGERWSALVSALRSALPAGLRDGGGWIDPALWPQAYPLDPEWPEHAARWAELWRLVGLVAEDGGEPEWAALPRRGESPEPAPLLALLPQEVDRVFLQNDLTAISPGPLAPELDVRLRGMAVRESHAQASTYRFTEASIGQALSAGETADGLRTFLSELSLTGLPQPLAYLIERTAERHGLVRISLDPETGHTVVSSRDHQLLDTIAVDQALRPLGLVPDGRLLRTRADRAAVYWALADARYPVVVIDEEGEAVALRRHRLAAAETPDADRYAALLARLRESESGDADAAWRERELDAAVREKATLVVTVALPDGSQREFTLEATGLGGGRLRGLDRGADVERTLPIRSIASLRRA